MRTAFIFFILSFILTGCIDKSTRKNNLNNTNTNTATVNCNGSNYNSFGCPGYVSNTTTSTTCLGNNYYLVAGCPGYCISYPSAAACQTGTTTGSSTGSTTSTQPLYPNWGVQYPGGVPSGSCSSTYVPSGTTNAFETRKGTITIVGGAWYNPSDAVAGNYLNTSSLLKSVSGAKSFFMTDSTAKVRFKVKPQPEAAQTTDTCYGRNMPASSIAGYTKLQFSVSLRGTRADDSTGEEPLGVYTVGVNSCSPGIDLSSYVSQYPKGIYLVVSNVKGNQGTWPSDYHTNGFKNSNTYMNVRTFDCWTMDLEVSADGTKTFD